MNAPLLEIVGVKKHFVSGGRFFGRETRIHAVDDVSLSIARGETLALVGESGSGKTTIGRAILRLFDITAGQIFLDEKRIDNLSAKDLHPLRRRMQIVFQDPYSSLNPRMRVRDIVAEPIRNFEHSKSNRDIQNEVCALMDKVHLPQTVLNRYPHEFSGGQRQRIVIARALAAKPDLVICDEAVSALDVSVKAQIVNLLQDIQRELGLALLFISHDLGIVEHIADRVAVMYLGKIVEIGPKQNIFSAPQHPYTQTLLSAIPHLDPLTPRKRIVLKGEVPRPSAPPSGCRFHTRCPYALARCAVDEPKLQLLRNAQFAACHLHDLSPRDNPLATPPSMPIG